MHHERLNPRVCAALNTKMVKFSIGRLWGPCQKPCKVAAYGVDLTADGYFILKKVRQQGKRRGLIFDTDMCSMCFEMEVYETGR